MDMSKFAWIPKLFCNLFIFKEKQRQIQIQKTYDMHIQFYTEKRHVIYHSKHFATLD